MSMRIYTNYSQGWVIEEMPTGTVLCDTSWMLLPAENLWNNGLRGFLYILALLYVFMGIAIVSDIFMFAIEVITSKKKTIITWDESTNQRIEREVLVWNETVANLTLMALGSSAPEILLAVIETLQTLDEEADKDSLGTFTIIGSAAFNLLIITAVCVVEVPSPQVKKIRELGVFALTSCWSIFAYFWMLVVLLWISPGQIEPWEAWLTLAFFPIMVLTAYCQDSGWWYNIKRASSVDAMDAEQNVRIVSKGARSPSVLNAGPSRELSTMEKGLNGQATRDKGDNKVIEDRFRHAAIRSMLGGKKRMNTPIIQPKSHMNEVVGVAYQNKNTISAPIDMFGKFGFSSANYSVLESAGSIKIDVLFNRRRYKKVVEDPHAYDVDEGMYTGPVSVEYETKEGSARFKKDLEYTAGKLLFRDGEAIKTISIPIINDFQYEADVDFYVTLKNPIGGGAIAVGEPSIARVLIIDDDEPGEFQFDYASYFANPVNGRVVLNVHREKGCDGNVTLEYGTIDGTAKGASDVNDGDYEELSGILHFAHNETKKQLVININTSIQETKNFLVTLRNPRIGAKLGNHSAVMVNITNDVLAERLAKLIEKSGIQEVTTWGGQFKSAMMLEVEQDDLGGDIPLTIVDYVLHFISFLWRVLFAFIPPRKYMGAWPAFILSLCCIAALTAIVEQLGSMLSCVIGLKASVAGITIIALGTSLPDLFASRTAALHDEYADAAIGNITGSNSVNVFLGLGLPWVIKAMYKIAKRKTYTVTTNNLVQSVLVFIIVGTICLIVLVMRRRFVGGELGGKNKAVKYLSASFMIMLWFIYIAMSSVQAYYPDYLPW